MFNIMYNLFPNWFKREVTDCTDCMWYCRKLNHRINIDTKEVIGGTIPYCRKFDTNLPNLKHCELWYYSDHLTHL